MSKRERNARLTRIAQRRFYKRINRASATSAAGVKRPDAPHVWYIAPFGEIVTEPITVLWFPGNQTQMILGSLEQSKKIVREECDAFNATWFKEVDGFKGIAITDPHWNGEQTFKCENCDAEHDVDENVATVLYQRFQHESQTAVN